MRVVFLEAYSLSLLLILVQDSSFINRLISHILVYSTDFRTLRLVENGWVFPGWTQMALLYEFIAPLLLDFSLKPFALIVEASRNLVEGLILNLGSPPLRCHRPLLRGDVGAVGGLDRSWVLGSRVQISSFIDKVGVLKPLLVSWSVAYIAVWRVHSLVTVRPEFFLFKPIPSFTWFDIWYFAYLLSHRAFAPCFSNRSFEPFKGLTFLLLNVLSLHSSYFVVSKFPIQHQEVADYVFRGS